MSTIVYHAIHSRTKVVHPLNASPDVTGMVWLVKLVAVAVLVPVRQSLLIADEDVRGVDDSG